MSVATQTDLEWYCLRAETKREHIAATLLRTQLGLEVYLPRIRHRKKTVRGPVWFTEALFPGYLFARLNLNDHVRQVTAVSGVSGVVHFNYQYQPLAESKMEQLKSMAQADEILEVAEEYREGDPVEIITGSLAGIRGLIRNYVPAKQRVTVLLEFLGREAEVDMSVTEVLPDKIHPLIR